MGSVKTSDLLPVGKTWLSDLSAILGHIIDSGDKFDLGNSTRDCALAAHISLTFLFAGKAGIAAMLVVWFW